MSDLDELNCRHYKGSRILITGGAGFLGAALAEALSPLDCSITILGRPGGREVNLLDGRAKIRIITGDIRDKDTWRQILPRTDYVFHCAGQTSAAIADLAPEDDIAVNVAPLLRMMETCIALNVRPKVLFSGTATQVGLTDQIPVNESFQDCPLIAYDINKLMAEKYLQYYDNRHNIPTVTLRLANVYGPGNSAGNSDRGILNQMVGKGLNGDTLTIYGEGKQIRDYVYIKDVVRAFLAAGATSTANGKYYVIGSGEGTSIANAIKLIAERVFSKIGRKPAVVSVDPPPSVSPIEARDFIADLTLFHRDTGWTPETSLKTGIDLTIEHLLHSKSS